MAEDKTYGELSKLAERIKDTTEGIEKEAGQMENAFDNISTMGEVTGDALNALTAKFKEYQSSIVSNAKVMNLTTAQQEKFRQESREATRSLLTLSDELAKGEGISKSSFAEMQKSMTTVKSGVSSFTGELSKSEREIESRKKEVGSAGAGMVARRMEESRTEYLEKLEAAYADGGLMKTSFTMLGKKLTDVVPGLSPVLETIKNSMIFQTTKQLLLPYWIRFKEWKFRRKLQKAQDRFFRSGGDPNNRSFDMQDRILGSLGKLGGIAGDFFREIRDVREKGLGIKDWHKLGERPFDTEQSRLLKEFVDKQNDANIGQQADLENSIADRESQKELLEDQIAATVSIGKDGKEIWPLEAIKKFNEELVPLHKQSIRDQEKILRLQESKMGLGSTEEIKRALEEANRLGRETEYLGPFGKIEVRFSDLIEITKDSATKAQRAADEKRQQDAELHSGSPPYASALPDILAQSEKQTTALEKDEGTKQKIGSVFGKMKGRLSGMLSGAVGFLTGIGTAIKGIPGRAGNLLKGIGSGIANMFKALGRIDPASLAIGLAAITGLSVNMVIIATALRIAAPAITAIFQGLGFVFSALGKVIRVLGDVIIGIGQMIIEFMTTFVSSLLELVKIPLHQFAKLAIGFTALGVSLALFAIGASDAIQPLLALGAAGVGLSMLINSIGTPENLAILSSGFDMLAGSVGRFARSVLTMNPVVSIFNKMWRIPFISKLLDLGSGGTLQGIQHRAGSIVVDKLEYGDEDANTARFLEAQALVLAHQKEQQLQAAESGGISTNIVVDSAQNNQYYTPQNPHDVYLTQSTNEVPR